MRLFFVVLCLFTTSISFAQKNKRDFSKIKPEQVDLKKLQQSLDSISKVTGYDSLKQLADFVNGQQEKPRYASIDIGYQLNFGRITDLNNGLKAMGIKEVPQNSGGFLFQLSHKGKRLLFNYGFSVAQNKRENNAYKIWMGTLTTDFGLGYDIVNRPKFQFYPQVHLGWQSMKIAATQKDGAQNIQDVNGLITNPLSSRAEKTPATICFGFQADYHINYSPSSKGAILGLRYGIASEFGNNKFTVNGMKSSYLSHDTMRREFLSLVFKLYLKHDKGSN